MDWPGPWKGTGNTPERILGSDYTTRMNVPCGFQSIPYFNHVFTNKSFSDSWSSLEPCSLQAPGPKATVLSHPDERLFQKRKPEKITTKSLLSELFTSEKRKASKPRHVTFRPPPGFEHLGPRSAIGRNEPGSAGEGRDTILPLPELRHLCPPGHSSAKNPSRGYKSGGRTRKPGGFTSQRPLPKPFRDQTCVDCVVVPYITTANHDIQDYILFDELHQIATFWSGRRMGMDTTSSTESRAY